MASGNKEKISWFGRILRRDKSGTDNSAFEEIDFEDALDDSDVFEGMDEDLSFEEGFDAEEDGEVAVPTQRTGAEDLHMNLVDKGDALIAQAIVPGIEESKIDIDLNREMLTITTESNEHCLEKDGDYLYEELTFGSFSRSVLLPAEVEVEDAKAEVKEGVLTIIMPKIDKEARKKLSVRKR